MNRNNIAALTLGLSAFLSCAALPAVVTHAQDLVGYGDDEVGEEGGLAAFRTHGSGWTSTSSGTSGLGRPATLTWSIVPDNSQLPTGLGEPVSNSNLIAFLDGVHHGGNSPGGADLTQRAWWQLMNSVFERWDEVSGIAFNYEPNDDGRKLGTASGILGTRGDHRIGGHSIDGQISPTFLAYNFFPNNADMVIDTDEINRWSNATNNYRLFRNMMMHEVGHGLGMNHVEPVNRTKLMEPFLATVFDGPQFDDILGIQRLYGDANEEGTGNDTFAVATSLGTVLTGQTISVGTDATDSFVAPGEIDFVSIDDNSDIDYFRFSINSPNLIDITLTPLGPTYEEGSTVANVAPFISSAQSNLTLALYDSDGTSLLEFSNDTGLGLSEQIDNFQLSVAGDYFVRVGGLNNTAQFFQLDVTAVPEPTTLLLLVLGSIGSTLTRRRNING
ncbi:MAG: matrixin family metalloprotease [Planctomycetes bacterium]|nr:matrixin family metalloprotease [Planctomycetota bacterium]